MVWVFLFFLSFSPLQSLSVYYTPSLPLSFLSALYKQTGMEFRRRGALEGGVLLSTDWMKSEIMKGNCLPEPSLVELFFPHPLCSSNYAFAFTDIS